jgi:hypothetical protein
MSGQKKVRGLSRDRHGRGVRRPLWSPKFEPGLARVGNFASTVEDAASYLREIYPETFAELAVEVRDIPPLKGELNSLRRFAFHRESNTVYVYRVPIQFTGRRRDPIDEMFRIETLVIEAAAEMMGRDPRDFLEDR